MAKQRRSNFKGKVGRNAEKQKKDASFNYLVLPKDMELFTPDPGTRVKLDFLPYVVQSKKHPDREDDYNIAVPGEDWYKRPFKIHRDIGADNEVVICLSSIGEKCPICEYRAKMKKDGADEDDIKALRPKNRNLYIVVPLGLKKWDEEPHIFDFSQFLLQDLLIDELEDDEEYEDFPHPQDGKTLKIRFDKESFGGQSFAKASRIDFMPRDYTYEDDLIDEMPDLDAIIEKSVLSYKELAAKFNDFDDDDYDDEELDDENEEQEEEEKPTRRKKKVVTRKKAEEEEEVEEEEEAPKKTVRKRAKPKKEVEEVEEEPEEEVKPTRRKRSAKPKEEKETEDRCPHGHKFGIDTDEHPHDCDECDIWDDCAEENENNK